MKKRTEHQIKQQRYDRLFMQLDKLFSEKKNDLTSRMSSIIALLHNKMDHFFWTGYYVLDNEGELMVASYQGTLACMYLPKDKGVCWESINTKRTVIVPNVEDFEGHIACSSLTKSEIVIPLFDKNGHVWACLDIDSKVLNNFNDIDMFNLEKIASHFLRKD